MANDAADTSASLLVRIRDHGDADAWATFVGVYGPLVRHYCLRKGLQDADAADVSQDVMLRVSQAIRTFEYSRERGRFRSWLGVIAANAISSRVSQNRRSSSASLPFDLVSPDPEWNEEFTDHILGLAMDRVRGDYSLDQWQLFESAWVRREPPPEIAARLGMAIQIVYVWKSRILLRLQAEILKLADDLPLPAD